MSTAAIEFLEDEFAGVQGVRERELFSRAEGIEHEDLKAALKEFPIRLKRYPPPEGNHYEWLPWHRLLPQQALRRLLGYAEWSEFFVDLCESRHLQRHLQNQAWQFQEELSVYGAQARLDDVQDALFDLAVELMPESPAANKEAFEEWAENLVRQARQFMHEQNVEPEMGSQFDRVNEMWFQGSRACLREAMRSWVKAALETKAAA